MIMEKPAQHEMRTIQMGLWNGLLFLRGTGKLRTERAYLRAAVTKRHGMANWTATPGKLPVTDARRSMSSVSRLKQVGRARTNVGTSTSTTDLWNFPFLSPQCLYLYLVSRGSRLSFVVRIVISLLSVLFKQRLVLLPPNVLIMITNVATLPTQS